MLLVQILPLIDLDYICSTSQMNEGKKKKCFTPNGSFLKINQTPCSWFFSLYFRSFLKWNLSGTCGEEPKMSETKLRHLMDQLKQKKPWTKHRQVWQSRWSNQTELKTRHLNTLRMMNLIEDSYGWLVTWTWCDSDRWEIHQIWQKPRKLVKSNKVIKQNGKILPLFTF